MENNNCHFQVGSLVTANLSWQLALPISIGANFGHNPYSEVKSEPDFAFLRRSRSGEGVTIFKKIRIRIGAGGEIFFSTMVLQIYYVTSASYPYSALTLA